MVSWMRCKKILFSPLRIAASSMEGSEYYGYAVEIWHCLNDVFKEACEEEGVALPPRFT
jgi:predicted SPOUT superfamily RNA methylase MTH1